MTHGIADPTELETGVLVDYQPQVSHVKADSDGQLLRFTADELLPNNGLYSKLENGTVLSFLRSSHSHRAANGRLHALRVSKVLHTLSGEVVAPVVAAAETPDALDLLPVREMNG